MRLIILKNYCVNMEKDGKEKQKSRPFEAIQAKQVAIANTKIYVNRSEGFIGTGLKKDEFVTEASDLDDIIAFTRGGTMKIVKVAEKIFIGKDIVHVAFFRKMMKEPPII